MKITDVKIDGFGVWSNLHVDQLSDRLTVFFGRNEAGKTTLMQFFRSVLYGYSRKRKLQYLPPVHGSNSGGSLHLNAPSGTFQVERQANLSENTNSLGEVVVTSSDGKRHGQHLLNHMLSGVDETIFNNVFAVGIRELQELGTLNDTQASDYLYKLASGVDRVSLVDVMKKLEESRYAIVGEGATGSAITRLLKRRERLRSELEEQSAKTARWSSLHSQHLALNKELDQLEADIQQMEHDARAVEVAVQVYDKWRAREVLDGQLDELGPLQELDDMVVPRLEELGKGIATFREELAPIVQRRRVIRAEVKSQPINQQLWTRACRIESVCEHGPWLSSLDDQIGRLEGEVTEVEVELLATDEKLGIANGMAVANLPDVSKRMMKALAAPVRGMSEASKRRKETKSAYEEARREADKTSMQYQTELEERRLTNLPDSINAAEERVEAFRNRIKLDERIDKMVRHLNDLEEEREDIADDELIPVRTFVGIGILFILGGTALLSAFTGYWDADSSLLVAFFGMCSMLGSAFWFLTQRRTNEFEQGDVERQMDKLDALIDKTKEERAQLDRVLPAGGGTMDSRLAGAEAELRELEALLPLEASYTAARKRRDTAKLRMEEAEEEVKRSHSRWKKTLNSVGLPSTLSPSDIKRLGLRTEENTVLSSQLTTRQEELIQRRRERAELVQRIRALVDEVGLDISSDDPQAQLGQLSAAIGSQREMVDRRRELIAEERELKRENLRLQKSLDALVEEYDEILEEVGVETIEEVHELVENLLLQADLCEQRDELTLQIDSMIGEHSTPEAVGAQILELPKEELERNWEALIARLQRCQGELTTLHERRGQCTQEMKTLASDRRISEVQMELSSLDLQLQRVATRYRTLTAVGNILESVRESYESDRQPETLGEASEYLAKLTEGKYTRIWTPLSENILRIEDDRGVTLPLDVLSRGTREAVFLSLRLALVTAYARRGIVLPIVLDDVLVNLDAERAKSAVRMLRDFANSGYQLLFFTCHEHMAQIFAEADVEVRQLPRHMEAVEKGVGTVLRPNLWVPAAPETPVVQEVVVQQPALAAADFDISDDSDLVDQMLEAEITEGEERPWELPEMWWDDSEATEPAPLAD